MAALFLCASILCLGFISSSETDITVGKDGIDISGLGVHYKHAVTWRKARHNCRNNGMELLSIENVDFHNKLAQQLKKARITNTLWLDGYEVRDSWIWSNDKSRILDSELGCFRGNEHIPVPTTYENNQPVLCASFCKHHIHTDYAAMMGAECYCLRDTFELQKLDDSMCDLPCPGNDMKRCGGNNSITVYNTTESLKWNMNEPGSASSGQDCALMLRVKHNETIVYSSHCQEKFNYICQIDRRVQKPYCEHGVASDSQCLIVSNKAKTWFDAARHCADLGGSLLYTNIDETSDVSLDNCFYWVGITKISQQWVGGKNISFTIPRSNSTADVDVSSQIDNAPRSEGGPDFDGASLIDGANLPRTCMAIQTSNGDHMPLESEDCSHKLQYICSYVRQPSKEHRFNGKYSKIYETTPSAGFIVSFYVIIPTTCGVFFLACLMVMLVSWNMRKRKAQTRITDTKPENKDHFYFILEKEENVYNTIEGLEKHASSTQESSQIYDTICTWTEEQRQNNNTPDYCRRALIATKDYHGPPPRHALTCYEHTYNHLFFKERLSNTMDHPGVPHNVMGRTYYDQVKLLSDYDTIGNVGQNNIFIDKPYDRCSDLIIESRNCAKTTRTYPEKPLEQHRGVRFSEVSGSTNRGKTAMLHPGKLVEQCVVQGCSGCTGSINRDTTDRINPEKPLEQRKGLRFSEVSGSTNQRKAVTIQPEKPHEQHKVVNSYGEKPFDKGIDVEKCRLTVREKVQQFNSGGKFVSKEN